MSQTNSINENLLLNELRNHNEKAFRKIYDLYSPAIYGYSLSILKSKVLAEESVQEVFLKVWMLRETINIEQNFKSFLFTIARNQAFNFLNKAANDSLLREELFYKSPKSHEEGDYRLREADCKQIRKQAISQLSPKRKLIFKMSRKHGKTYEEISTELGLSIHTVKNHMSKALESLRLFFKNYDEIF